MAKLYFRYGTCSSAKTLNLLSVAHTYELQRKKCILIKPSLDNIYGNDIIGSRAGLFKKADIVLDKDDIITDDYITEDVMCILVDEVQFLTKKQINKLRSITVDYNIPVVCYGLRTDFRLNFFEGSARMMELADVIEEVKNTCDLCNKKSFANAKVIDNIIITDGSQVEISHSMFLPYCFKCFFNKLKLQYHNPFDMLNALSDDSKNN